MRFTDYLNEGYSKELSKQLKAYGLSKKVGDLLAKRGVSINDAETRRDLDKIIKDKPLGITSAIKEIKNKYLSNFNGGYLIFVHDTKGVTLISTHRSDFRDVNLNRDNRTEIGDTDGKIISVYIIEANYNDLNGHRSTAAKRRDRQDRQSSEDSTEVMKNNRDYVIKKRDELNNALKNKTIKKIYDILTGVGFEIKNFNDLPAVTIRDNSIFLNGVSMHIRSDEGPDIGVYIHSNLEGVSKLDTNLRTSVEISVSTSNYDYFANATDNITDEYYKLVEVSKALSKVSEILKKSTYKDLLVD